MNAFIALFKDKDKKMIINLAMLFAVGLFIFLSNGSFFKPKQTETNQPPETEELAGRAAEVVSYESRLEKRLEEALSLVNGVGRVKVMITLRYGKEIVVGRDSSSNQSSTKEADAQGGTRETSDRSSEEKTIIITDKDGVGTPLILQEKEPKIEGVIIVAEGGDNVFVKEALTKAAETILGVEANKVQILKMKE